MLRDKTKKPHSHEMLETNTDNPKLWVTSLDLATACAFVAAHHRHNQPPRGHKFSLGLYRGSTLVGVAIVGRPVARGLDKHGVLEVTRVAVIDGQRNGCSMLYGACQRVAKQRGCPRLVTYTRVSEGAHSVRGANFKLEAANCGAPVWRGKRSGKPVLQLGEYKNRWAIVLHPKQWAEIQAAAKAAKDAKLTTV